MKIMKSISLLFLALVLIVFSVANRHVVPVDLWPFSSGEDMPLFVVFFIGIFVGLILAGVLLAFRGVRHYTEMRSAKAETARLSDEVGELEGELDKKPAKVDQKDYTETAPAKATKLAKGSKSH